MYDPFQIRSIVAQDPRYKSGAYDYVCDVLNFARMQLGMGHSEEQSASIEIPADEESDEPEPFPQHISVQELCEAIRFHAIWRFGFLAKTVFNQWGIQTTDDFGEIVFNLVNVGKIRLAPEDTREDFHHVFDFQTVFCDEFTFPGQ